MAGWFDEIRLESWSEFKGEIDDWLRRNDNTDARRFRGQARAEWKLESGFDRLPDDNRTRKARAHDAMVRDARERFVHAKEVPPSADLDDAEVMAILQHEGVPTRLLDWSHSPYVAAFFAFSEAIPISGDDEPTSDMCAVFSLDHRCSALTSDQAVALVETRGLFNERVHAQRGCFTMNRSLFTALEEFFDAYYETESPPQPVLTKFLIPLSETRLALRDLELMGVSSQSLFPGRAGVARYSFYRALDRARDDAPAG